MYVEAWALHYIQIMKMCILHPVALAHARHQASKSPALDCTPTPTPAKTLQPQLSSRWTCLQLRQTSDGALYEGHRVCAHVFFGVGPD